MKSMTVERYFFSTTYADLIRGEQHQREVYALAETPDGVCISHRGKNYVFSGKAFQHQHATNGFGKSIRRQPDHEQIADLVHSAYTGLEDIIRSDSPGGYQQQLAHYFRHKLHPLKSKYRTMPQRPPVVESPSMFKDCWKVQGLTYHYNPSPLGHAQLYPLGNMIPLRAIPKAEGTIEVQESSRYEDVQVTRSATVTRQEIQVDGQTYQTVRLDVLPEETVNISRHSYVPTMQLLMTEMEHLVRLGQQASVGMSKKIWAPCPHGWKRKQDTYTLYSRGTGNKLPHEDSLDSAVPHALAKVERTGRDTVAVRGQLMRRATAVQGKKYPKMRYTVVEGERHFLDVQDIFQEVLSVLTSKIQRHIDLRQREAKDHLGL